jgi:hypothetical protein
MGFLSGFPAIKISSVFPPTTTAAITSYLTGLDPIEHGALGWTLFFKEYARYIDFLPIWDAAKHDKLNDNDYRLNDLISHKNIFSLINEKNKNVKLSYLTPEHIYDSNYTVKNSFPAEIYPYRSMENMFEELTNCVLDNEERKFIYSYSVNPDSLEHKYGVFSTEVREYLQNFISLLENFSRNIEGTGTVLLLTADHGLTDVNEYKYVNDDDALSDCLYLPVFPEPRFASLFVKNHRKKDFLKAVSSYMDKFILMDRNEFFQSGLLGNGIAHKKIDDFIGDYLLIAKEDTAIKPVYEQAGKADKEFVAHHAGLTSDEMSIPLVIMEF